MTYQVHKLTEDIAKVVHGLIMNHAYQERM